VNFSGITNNSAGQAVGSGGKFDSQIQFRPTLDDNQYGDVKGYYILIDANTATWQVPTVSLDGVTLSNVKGKLNADEAIAYNAYEYVYKSTKPVYYNNEQLLRVQTSALSGVNPAAGTDDIRVDFAPIGAYTSVTDSNLVKYGSVQDDSSQTVVGQLDNTRIAVS
jgi:hypothetical protein